MIDTTLAQPLTAVSEEPQSNDALRLPVVEAPKKVVPLATKQCYVKNAVEQELKLCETTTVIREEEISKTDQIPDEDDTPTPCPDRGKRSREDRKSH